MLGTECFGGRFPHARTQRGAFVRFFIVVTWIAFERGVRRLPAKPHLDCGAPSEVLDGEIREAQTALAGLQQRKTEKEGRARAAEAVRAKAPRRVRSAQAASTAER